MPATDRHRVISACKQCPWTGETDELNGFGECPNCRSRYLTTRKPPVRIFDDEMVRGVICDWYEAVGRSFRKGEYLEYAFELLAESLDLRVGRRAGTLDDDAIGLMAPHLAAQLELGDWVWGAEYREVAG